MGKLPEVWPSGQRQQTVNLSGKALRWFESIHLHHFLPSRVRGSNSGVESQPSKLLVAGSIPVSRSTPRGAPAWCVRRESAFGAHFARSAHEEARLGQRIPSPLADAVAPPASATGCAGAPAGCRRRRLQDRRRPLAGGRTIRVPPLRGCTRRAGQKTRAPSRKIVAGLRPAAALSEFRRTQPRSSTPQPPPPSPPLRPATTGTPAP